MMANMILSHVYFTYITHTHIYIYIYIRMYVYTKQSRMLLHANTLECELFYQTHWCFTLHYAHNAKQQQRKNRCIYLQEFGYFRVRLYMAIYVCIHARAYKPTQYLRTHARYLDMFITRESAPKKNCTCMCMYLYKGSPHPKKLYVYVCIHTCTCI